MPLQLTLQDALLVSLDAEVAEQRVDQALDRPEPTLAQLSVSMLAAARRVRAARPNARRGRARSHPASRLPITLSAGSPRPTPLGAPTVRQA
jgi:hypothetical protein